MDSLKKNHLFALRQRQLYSITLKVMLVVFTSVVLSSGLGGPSSTAHAQSLGRSPGTPNIVGTVHAFLDCSKGSKAAQAYSIQHHYCTTTTSRSIVPDGTTSGNCGTAYLYGNSIGGGLVNYSIGGTAYGTLVAVDYTIRWTGGAAGDGLRGPNWVPVPFQFGWSSTTQGLTGRGSVFASATGHYFLWWGGICAFNDLYTLTQV